MASIGENAAKAMVYESDFFRSKNMTATGVTTQHALKVFNALKSYESKVFELCSLTQCLMLLGMAIRLLLTRIEQIQLSVLETTQQVRQLSRSSN